MIRFKILKSNIVKWISDLHPGIIICVIVTVFIGLLTFKHIQCPTCPLMDDVVEVRIVK